jgi:LPXTG-motif cell wall-anchored protein
MVGSKARLSDHQPRNEKPMKFKASIIAALIASALALTASPAGAATDAGPPETTIPPSVTGPATVDQPPVRSTPDSCILFDDTSLAEGDYVLGTVDGVTVGTTAKFIVPCKPVVPPVTVTVPAVVDVVTELPETGAETTMIALLALLVLLTGATLTFVSRDRTARR